MRHARATIFGPDLVGPGWSVLLELYRARLEGRPVRIARLAIDSRIPSTTALRWLDQLAGRGLIERRADPAGGRAIHVALTEDAAAAIADHFAALKAGWALG
jgi:DNA-binding MarR family transcriptional regulator